VINAYYYGNPDNIEMFYAATGVSKGVVLMNANTEIIGGWGETSRRLVLYGAQVRYVFYHAQVCF
jgi:hypothetical protein